ncbi:unnamed protein product [Oppiella nova]|uniref:Uncharacterized protein n=1 Tax=Oppiella nova TaxID=334625 RepID=A0A7R9QWP7_9ACAR|nr:unnamed protein product [Oppiella nova]CAG2177853.1 unnamed protein product [Oppiella nova]
MILTSDGCVYGWGYNMDGQLGCGPDSDIQNKGIFRVHFNPNHEIKSIYCCAYSSFAITSEGQAFSWGRNHWYNLGHNSSDNIWEPQLIADMTGIKTICSNGGITFILSNDGFIRFCELSNNGMNCVEVSFIEYVQPVRVGVYEVNEYKRVCEELHSLGSGAFGENIVSNISINGVKPKYIIFKWNCVPIVCRLFLNTNHKYLVENRKNP